MKNERAVSIILVLIPLLMIAAGVFAGICFNAKAEEASIAASPKREDYATLAGVIPCLSAVAAGCVGLPLSVIVKRREVGRSGPLRVIANVEFVFGIVCAAIAAFIIIALAGGIFQNISKIFGKH